MEKGVSKRFNFTPRLVVVSCDELKRAVRYAPEGFGNDPAKYRYDVIFLKKPLTGARAIKWINPKEGVDTAHAGKDVLYFSRLIRRAAQSHLTRIIQLPIYQQMTIRNWNTTTKLLALMDKRSKNAPR